MGIINITVIDREGDKQTLDAPTDMGLNLMEFCKSYDFPVQGTCGGMCMCSTCHIYILSDHQLPEMAKQEEEVLDFAFFVKPNSRLGCQIRLTDELDNLVIQIAPEND